MRIGYRNSLRSLALLAAAGSALAASQVDGTVIFSANYDANFTPQVAAGSNAVVFSQGVSITSGGPAVSGESLSAITGGATRLIYNTGANLNTTKGTASFDVNLASKVVGTSYPLDLGAVDLNATDGLLLFLTHGPLTGSLSEPSRWLVSWDGQSIQYFETINTGEWENVAVSWDMTGGAGNGDLYLLIDGVVVASRSDLNPIGAFAVPNMYLAGSQHSGIGSIRGYMDNFQITDELAPAIPEPASLGMLTLAGAAVLRRRR